MAHLKKSVVALRVHGDDLIPEEITRLLGVPPSYAKTKGEKTIGQKTARVTVAKGGIWVLNVPDREPEDMDGQIREIFSQTTTDLGVWQSIAKRYRIDLFCGLFMGVSNEGLTLSQQSLAVLGERGIEMDLDIYSGKDDEHEKSS